MTNSQSTARPLSPTGILFHLPLTFPEMTDGHSHRAVPRAVLLTTIVVFVAASAMARQPNPSMHESPKAAVTNAASDDGHWHTVRAVPRVGQPAIHAGDRMNPVWWFENVDEPNPPLDYRPHDHHRHHMWAFRNSFHNFTSYVIGISDKKFTRSGKYPNDVMNPHGGWNFAVTKYKFLRLPFVSYHRGGFNFYLGWRERGNFGLKLNHRSKRPASA